MADHLTRDRNNRVIQIGDTMVSGRDVIIGEVFDFGIANDRTKLVAIKPAPGQFPRRADVWLGARLLKVKR